MSSSNKTPRSQRIGIWIIAIVMIIGTLAGLAFMVLANQNSSIDPNTIAREEASKESQKQYKEYKEQLEQARQKFRGLDGYTDKIGQFDAKSITSLSVESLKSGEGATVSEKDSLKVNYTGWTPDGKIFDSTKSDGQKASPTTLSLSKLVDGWKEGLAGQKVGGVYLLSIPSDKAYGESGSSDGSIPANTPIKFIVEIISIEKDKTS